jgi:hypothetical protein
MARLVSSSDSKLVFLEHRKVEKEGKQPLHFVSLGDPAKYQKLTFLADKNIPFYQFGQGEVVQPVFELDSYNDRPSLRLIDLLKVNSK